MFLVQNKKYQFSFTFSCDFNSSLFLQENLENKTTLQLYRNVCKQTVTFNYYLTDIITMTSLNMQLCICTE